MFGKNPKKTKTQTNMNLVLTINNRRTHTNTVDYLKKCICMYLHTGVKRVCTKMSHRLTITKKKHFPFLQLQVLKKKLCTEKRAWWRDRTLETTLHSHDVLNETGEKKSLHRFLNLNLYFHSGKKNLVHPSPSPASRRFQSVLTKRL